MVISWYEMTNPMVRNGNFMVRNDRSYGTKWLWYEMFIILIDLGRIHSEHLGQSLNQASDVCRRSDILRKLTCIAGSSYSSAALYEIIP